MSTRKNEQSTFFLPLANKPRRINNKAGKKIVQVYVAVCSDIVSQRLPTFRTMRLFDCFRILVIAVVCVAKLLVVKNSLQPVLFETVPAFASNIREPCSLKRLSLSRWWWCLVGVAARNALLRASLSDNKRATWLLLLYRLWSTNAATSS